MIYKRKQSWQIGKTKIKLSPANVKKLKITKKAVAECTMHLSQTRTSGALSSAVRAILP
jgi:hypothetical protein